MRVCGEGCISVPGVRAKGSTADLISMLCRCTPSLCRATSGADSCNSCTRQRVTEANFSPKITPSFPRRRKPMGRSCRESFVHIPRAWVFLLNWFYLPRSDTSCHGGRWRADERTRFCPSAYGFPPARTGVRNKLVDKDRAVIACGNLRSSLRHPPPVIPAQAGIHVAFARFTGLWIPACAHWCPE